MRSPGPDRAEHGHLDWRRGACGVVFLLALAARWGYWSEVRAHRERPVDSFHAVRGIPFSDAHGWDFASAELARGAPLPWAWSARRPVYPALLAAVYVWTGHRIAVGVFVSALWGASAAALLVHLAWRSTGWASALALGCWAALDPRAVAIGTATLSEPVGLWLLVWHFDRMRSATVARPAGLLASGALFALSNAARPLTLAAAPLYLGSLYVAGRWSRRGRGALVAAALFAVGVAVVLAPFLAIGWHRHRLISLSDNTASALYAAASPKYGHWSGAVEQEATDLGLSELNQRHAYFMQAARREWRAHPSVYVRNVLRSATHITQQLVDLPPRPLWLLAHLPLALVCLSDAFRARVRPLSLRSAAVASLAVLVCGATTHGWPALVWAVALTYLVVTSVIHGRAISLHLLALLVGSMAGLAALCYWEDRFSVVLAWMLIWPYFAAVCSVSRWIAGAVTIETPYSAGDTGSSDDDGLLPATWRLALGGLFALSLLFLAARQGVGPALAATGPVPHAALVSSCLAAIERVQPDLLADDEQTAPLATDLELVHRHSLAFQGQLTALVGRVTPYVYDLPADREVGHPWRFFSPRPYARQVFYFTGHDADGRPWYTLVVVPGEFNSFVESRQVLLLARVHAAADKYQEVLLEAVALVPLNADTSQPEFNLAQFALDEDHRELLHQLDACRPVAP